MPPSRLVAGPFAALEPRLFETIDEVRAGDPLRRVDVLVGSNLVAVYLRRAYAERRGAVANLRFLTFLDLARERVTGADPRPPLPPLGDEALAARVLRDTPEAAAFGPLRGRPALARALLATAGDLREARLSSEEFRSLVPHVAATEDRRLFLSAVADCMAPLEAARAPFFDDHALFAKALLPLAPRPDPLLVYGPYDLGGVREALLARVAAERPVFAFVPHDSELRAEEGPGSPAVRRSLFARLLGTRGDVVAASTAPPDVARVSASTENVEAREVVREVLAAVDAGIPLHKIAVLLREPRTQEPAIAAELTLARLPFYSPAGSRPSRSPAGLLARLLVDPEEGSRLSARTEREAKGILEALGLDSHAAILRPPSSPASYAEWSARLRSSVDATLGARTERAPLHEAAAVIGRLGSVDPSPFIPMEEIAALLPRALDLETTPVGRFERDGLSILSAVSARGLLFDAVVVPGLRERAFPKPGRPDPLLFDEERVAIAKKTGRPLATRGGARHLLEERFLFSLTRGAARRRLVLLAPRYDAENGRLLGASPFFLEGTMGESPLRRTPLGKTTCDGPAISRHEASRRRIAASGVTPELLAAEPLVADALDRSAARRRPFFTPYEGLLSSDTRDVLGRRALSASALERLASCGYKFFWRDLLNLAVTEPPASLALDPRAVGNLVHVVLRDAAREVVSRHGRFASLSAAEAGELVTSLSHAAAKRYYDEELPDVPAAFVDIAAERVAAIASRAVEHERTRLDALEVEGAEVAFGNETPLVVEAGPLTLALKGRIDRLDRRGDLVRVVDYKTGKRAPFGKKNNRRLVAGAEKLQLPVYALAARARGATAVVSEYLFVDEDGASPVAFGPEETRRAVEAFTSAIPHFFAAAGGGSFLPRTRTLSQTSGACAACDFNSICGPGHERIFEKKRASLPDDHPLRLLEALP